MYVVRRPFRNLGKVFTVGSTIEDPTVIKHFKSRLAEGKIIVVDEHNYAARAKYFKDRFGVTLPSLEKPAESHEEKVEKPEESHEEKVEKQAVAYTEEKKVQAAKVVAATAK